MTDGKKQLPEWCRETSFFDGMPIHTGKAPEEEAEEQKPIKPGDKVIQDDKEYLVIATPKEPGSFVIPDKHYCVVKDIETAKKYFFKL